MSEAAIAPAPITAAPITAPAPTPTPAPSNDPWYQGFDADTIGYLQNRGLDRKTPTEAIQATIKAHRDAEKFVGVPTDQLVRMPKDAADEAAWNNLYSKLGKPADAKEYDFTAVKFSDGTVPDDNFTNLMRETAYKISLPKDKALEMTQAFAKYLDTAKVNESADITARLTEEKKALANNWGPNMEANLFVAKAGAQTLGLTPQDVSALEGVVGYAKVMEAMRRVGVLNKEDRFVNSESNPNAVMTKEQAVARMTELMSDKGFSEKLIKGDAEAGRQWKALQIIRAG